MGEGFDGGNWSSSPGPLKRRRPATGAGTRAFGRSGALGWVDAGCSDRIWWIRLPVLLWCAWMWKGHLTDPQASDIVKGLNLGIHELGHILWSPFGQFLTILGGSLTQCLAPLVGTAMFLRQRDPFAVAFSFSWLATNLFDVATYCADARSMDLPLVSPFGGDEIIHDWNWILGHLGLLAWDQRLASLLRLAGSGSFLVSLVGMGYCLWRMRASPGKSGTFPS